MHNSILLSLLLVSIMWSCTSKSELIEIKDENGRVTESYHVKTDNIKHGEYTALHENGKTRESATYIDGELDGVRKIFYDNGSVEIEENYVNGTITGDYKVYYVNGQLKIETSYKDGAMNGELKKYNEKGILIEEVTMVDNEENGPFKEYHDNGKLHWEGNYLNGDNEFGLLLKYNEDGELIRKMNCDSLAVCRTFWTKEKGDVTPEQ